MVWHFWKCLFNGALVIQCICKSLKFFQWWLWVVFPKTDLLSLHASYIQSQWKNAYLHLLKSGSANDMAKLDEKRRACTCIALPPLGRSDTTWTWWLPDMFLLWEGSPCTPGWWGGGHRRPLRHCRTSLSQQTGMDSVSHMERTLIIRLTASISTSDSVRTPPCTLLLQ